MPQYAGRELDSTDYRNAAVLECLYWDNDLSSRDIADIFDVHKDTILRWMEKNNIDRKDRIEAVKDKVETGHVPLQYHRGRQVWAHHYEGDREYVKVTRLLAVAEYGFEETASSVVHHKNGIKWLDVDWNIETLTAEEHGRIHNTGSSHPQTDLDEETVKEIRRLGENMEYAKVAEKMPVSESTVSDICRGYSWSHID